MAALKEKAAAPPIFQVASAALRITARAAVIFLVGVGLVAVGLWSVNDLPAGTSLRPFDSLLGGTTQQAEALLYVYDNDTGWKPNPYTQLHYVESHPFGGGEPRDVRLRTNSEGFFDREHYVSTPYYRIAFLGDSWVEAQQVDRSQRFTDLLEQYVFSLSNGRRAVETMNFGVSNLGTAQEYGVAKTYVARYRPNEIWVLFNPVDDLTDSSPLYTSPPLGPTFVTAGGPKGTITDIRFGYVDPPPVAEEWRHKRYGDLIAHLPGQVRAYLYARESHPAFDAIFDETRQALRLLKNVATRAGAKLVVVYLPMQAETDADQWSAFASESQKVVGQPLHLDAALGERRVEAMVRGEGIDFLSLAPLIREKGNKEMFQRHFSRMGHHWVADFMARHLLTTACCARPPETGDAH
ncbi:MAG: hypothetical protein ACM3X5_09140 [Bacillota bacterium]